VRYREAKRVLSDETISLGASWKIGKSIPGVKRFFGYPCWIGFS
jgi:hypothetical protein